MILVDTSILIDYLRGIENEPARRFQYVLDRNLPFGISSVVYQEVLQEVKSEISQGLFLARAKPSPIGSMLRSTRSSSRIFRRAAKKGRVHNSHHSYPYPHR